MLPLNVLGDRVLVKPDVEDRAPEQVGSVYVAQSLAAAVTGTDAVTSVCRGTVVAVGTPRHPLHDVAEDMARRLATLAHDIRSKTLRDVYLDAGELLMDLTRRQPSCAVGDDVLFNFDAGQRIDLADSSYIILHEADLLAIVTPELEVA